VIRRIEVRAAARRVVPRSGRADGSAQDGGQVLSGPELAGVLDPAFLAKCPATCEKLGPPGAVPGASSVVAPFPAGTRAPDKYEPATSP
jgi:hypothetical protein